MLGENYMNGRTWSFINFSHGIRIIRHDHANDRSFCEADSPPLVLISVTFDSAMAVSPHELTTYLSAVTYPVTKERLLLSVRDQGAHDDVLEILDSLGDREYADSSDVLSELGAVML